MSRMMSRRAVLRAIGVSPVVLAASGVSGSEAQAQSATLLATYWDPSLDPDLDRVVAKGREEYKRLNGGADWDVPTEERTYRSLGKTLYTHYMAGIDFRRLQHHPNKKLAPPPGFLWDAAFDCSPTNSGTKVVENLRSFVMDDGSKTDEVRICAWRCGWLAADTEIKTNPASPVVACDSYKYAWESVRDGIYTLMAKLKAQGKVHMLSSGGAC